MRKRRSKARKAKFERDTFSARKRRRGKSLKRQMLEGDEVDLSDHSDDFMSLDLLYGPQLHLD